MKTALLAATALVVLVSCATPNPAEKVAVRYQCDNGMQVSLSHQDAARNNGTLTFSQVAAGNVEARSIAVNRISHPTGEAWSNTAEQTQWVDRGGTAELTYPVEGVVRLFACRQAAQ